MIKIFILINTITWSGSPFYLRLFLPTWIVFSAKRKEIYACLFSADFEIRISPE